MNIIAVATSDYIGFILLIAVLVSSRIRRASESRAEFRIFTLIAVLTMVACVLDFSVFYVDGKSGNVNRLINLLGNAYCFFANPVYVASWCLFEDIKLYHSKARVKSLYVPLCIPAAIMAALAIVNIFIPIIYYIDEANLYHRLPFSYVYYIVDLGYLLFSVYNLKHYERGNGKVRFFPLYLMIGPIIMGCGLQAFFYGISLIWVSLAVGLAAIYMSLQNEFSYLDTLTGLYNRAYLDYQIESEYKEGRIPGGIMIDVDFFKGINDTYGHSKGDMALKDVARLINNAAPENAITARFAGDEFLILVRSATDDNMKAILESIRGELGKFNESAGRPYKLSLSMGYSIYDPDSTVDDFLKKMDENMYNEKKEKHRGQHE